LAQVAGFYAPPRLLVKLLKNVNERRGLRVCFFAAGLRFAHLA
jgi:hypothetical protein